MRTGVANLPNEPKIPLHNYLLELVTSSDGKENSLYISNINNIIKKIWDEIVKNNWKCLNVRKTIPKKLGVHSTSFYGYKNGKKAISIQMLYNLLCLWKEKCSKTDSEFKEKWDKIFNEQLLFSTHSKHQKTMLPKYITPNLSYLIGWLCGDGHLKESHNYLVKISEKSVNQLEYVLKPLIKELFSIDVPIFRRYKGGYAIQFGNKTVYKFLTLVLRIKVGEIPYFINRLDSINKKYFLMGLIDSEGYISDSYKESSIITSQAKKKFLEQIISLFNELNIKFTGPYIHKTKLGVWYTIRIRRKSEILEFNKIFGSYHVDKIQRLKNLVSEIENRYSKSTVA
ncbi:MAG: hypothetical protein JSW73_04985 [Candidatus Woesearchaeota archaeon]|nr:MAG: hypothetical protein JSW73_04985 [Candidatus Woesearchaeota archaeon]